MSGTLPTQDFTAQLRDAAVISLLAYNGIAGAAVEAERVDVVPSGSMPRIVVFADDDGQVKSRAGTSPVFDVSGTLVVQCLAERATKADAVADLDALVAQVKDCLLRDPVWLTLAGRIDRLRTQRSYKPQGERIIGDARIEITCAWVESYAPPRITTVLDGIDVTITGPASAPATPASTPVPVNVTVNLG